MHITKIEKLAMLDKAKPDTKKYKRFTFFGGQAYNG
jgi:hypothetical protein